MSDKMDRQDSSDSGIQDTPNSVQEAPPTQKPESANRSIYAQSGGAFKVKTITKTVKIQSSSDGKSASKTLPTEMPRDVSNLYLNDGVVLEADTIDSFEVIHNIGQSQGKQTQ